MLPSKGTEEFLSMVLDSSFHENSTRHHQKLESHLERREHDSAEQIASRTCNLRRKTISRREHDHRRDFAPVDYRNTEQGELDLIRQEISPPVFKLPESCH